MLTITEACAQGLHQACDGTGTLNDGAIVLCECPCHVHDDVIEGIAVEVTA